MRILLASDFGDAPAPYPTLLAELGAEHIIDETQQQYTLEVMVTDGDGLSDSALLTINVTDGNDPPMVVNPPANQTRVGGSSFEITLPADVFDDENVGDTLVLSASLADGVDLPDWLIFDAVAGKFTGSPSWDLDTTVEVKATATATDSGDPALSAGATFHLTVTRNEKPWQNPVDRFDVNGIRGVEPRDVWILMRDINALGSQLLDPPPAGLLQPLFYDVNGDGRLTPIDPLLLINHINWVAAAAAGGEAMQAEVLNVRAVQPPSSGGSERHAVSANLIGPGIPNDVRSSSLPPLSAPPTAGTANSGPYFERQGTRNSLAVASLSSSSSHAIDVEVAPGDNEFGYELRDDLLDLLADDVDGRWR